MLPPFSLEQAIDKTIREEWGRIMAVLVKTLRDFQLAEDCLQDAVEAALRHWPKTGLPKSPAAWLIKTARRKAIDRLRRAQNFASKSADIAYLIDLDNKTMDPRDPQAIPDKRLELMFTCCHPALAEKTRTALTLRTIGGLTTDEIAAAFLDKPEAMAQRLVRAKKKIKASNIPYNVPEPDVLPSRLRGVLSVIYLIFNEGYAASSGDTLTRINLSDEAIRLARIMTHLMPNEPETHGLLALMLLHDSRRPARQDSEGRIVPLEDQDRSRWDKNKREAGLRVLNLALTHGQPGPYQIQASISALHCQSPDWAETDWPQIAALYQELYTYQPSPVVRINQAMAISFAQSPEAALDILNGLEAMDSYKPYILAKADLMTRSGQIGQARPLLERALELTSNAAERDFLTRKLTEF